jgi:nucleoside-diphosphate-sugar epimerase
MEILIVGGTGNISWRFALEARDEGWRVTLLNRGAPDRLRRSPPAGCGVIVADIKDEGAVGAALGARRFDAVVDFVCYDERQARRAVGYFSERARHYVFISSTAIYDREIADLPLVETAPVICAGWDYALAKAAAESAFGQARLAGFPVTVMRPGHTYDTIIPEAVGDGDWTNPWRLLNGKPIVLHGDGTTLWTLTHSIDFARAVVEFLKSGHPPGETFQVTSDDAFTWREIAAMVCRSVGVDDQRICYRTTQEIDAVAPRYGAGIKHHKMWCDLYDNRKFKTACPSWRAGVSLRLGIEQAVAYYRADARRMAYDGRLNAVLDELCGMRQ